MIKEQDTKTMKIYRGLAISEELNTENVGISWTLCKEAAEDKAESMQKFNGAENIIVMSCEVSNDDIDWEATLGQMTSSYFESEYEVVLNDNIDIEVRIDDDYTDCNTGSNEYDETMTILNEVDEDLKEEFLSIAEEF